MNCWNCGKELTDGAAFCTGCGASAARREPETPEGRTLLDHYGVEKALESSFRLPGGLGDPTACCLTAFFPPSRVLQVAMAAAWLRGLRKRQG